MQIMRTKTPTVVVTGAEGSGGTTGRADPTRIANGEMGVRGDATPPVRIGRPHNSSGPLGLTAQQAETLAPAHIGTELRMQHPAGTGTNRFKNKSNRQPSK